MAGGCSRERLQFPLKHSKSRHRRPRNGPISRGSGERVELSDDKDWDPLRASMIVPATNVTIPRGASACGARRSMSFGPVALPEAC